MISLLERVGQLLTSVDQDDPTPDERALHLASAVLLFEVARSDHQLEPVELDRLRLELNQHWNLGDGELRELLEMAEKEAHTNASLHAQIEIVNSRFSLQRKFELLKGLWSVAFADGKVHHYEEHLIRRLADLLHMPHREFIRAKHEVMNSL